MVIWKDVLGYEGLYSVSNNGDIRGNERVVKHHKGGPKRLKERIRKPVISTHGYLTVILSKEGRNVRHAIHRLVLSTFAGEPKEKSDACHCDGDRKNNSISNLRWDTRTGNMQDTKLHGTYRSGEKIHFAKLTEEDVKSILSDDRPQKLIAKSFGIDQSAVSLIKTGKRWKHL